MTRLWNPTTFVGAGVDIVAISRVRDLLKEFGNSARTRLFTPAERQYCSNRPHPGQHYAARWAAKEAFRKALPSDTAPVPFRSVGVRRTAAEPTLELDEIARSALEAAVGEDAEGATAVRTAVSLSHDRRADRAIAQVLLIRSDGEPPRE